MIKGAIFDADGVLLDSLMVWKNLGSLYLEEYNVKPEPGLDKELFSMSMEQGVSYLKNKYSLNKSEEEILEEVQKMIRDYYYFEIKMKEGVQDILEFFKEKNIKMSVATSSPKEFVERALERNGISTYFSKILTASETGESKHSPSIYMKSAEFLGLMPEEIIVFEDSLYALETAVRAGFFGIGVCDKYGELKQKELELSADIYLESFKNPEELHRLPLGCWEFYKRNQ